MANVALELIWFKNLLIEIGFALECPIRLYGNNMTTIHIVENSMFYEKIKHIEVNCHIVRKKLEANIFVAKYIASRYQLAVLTKPLDRTRVDFFLASWTCMIFMLQLEREC